MLTKNIFRFITLCFLVAGKSLFAAHDPAPHVEGHSDGGHGNDSGEAHSHGHAHHAHHEAESNEIAESDPEGFKADGTLEVLAPEAPLIVPSMGDDDGYAPPKEFARKQNQPPASSTIAVDKSADYEEISLPNTPQANQLGYLEDSVPVVANGLGLIKKPVSMKTSKQASQKIKPRKTKAKPGKTRALKKGKIFQRQTKTAAKKTNKNLPNSLD